MAKFITVSCHGDDELRKALRLLALSYDVEMGYLTRLAINQTFGQELSAILEDNLLADSSGVYIHHKAELQALKEAK
jgi:hypothetical protein